MSDQCFNMTKYGGILGNIEKKMRHQVNMVMLLKIHQNANILNEYVFDGIENAKCLYWYLIEHMKSSK